MNPQPTPPTLGPMLVAVRVARGNYGSRVFLTSRLIEAIMARMDDETA